MKLSHLLWMILPAAIVGQNHDNLYIYDCDVQYSVKLSSMFQKRGTVGKCTDEEMEAITNMIHSVVEQDVISSMLGVAVPQFMAMYEAFAPGAVLVPHVVEPPKEVMAMHMTLEDIKTDIEMTGCGEEDPMCMELKVEDALEEEAALNATDAGAVADDEAGRRLQEVEEEVEVEPAEWVPYKYGDRRLQAMDCGVSQSCHYDWCCGICSYCKRRRRNLRKLQDENANEKVLVRTNGKPKTTEEERAIRRFEKRVGRMIKRQLRRLSRQNGAYACLGNFWQLDVEFIRHFFEYVR